MNKIIGNLVGTTLPQIKVDEVLDANSSNAIANKVVAEFRQDFDNQSEGYGQQFDNYKARITEMEERFGSLESIVEQNEQACLETAKKVGDIDTALDRIIEIQNSLIGGDA